MVILSTFMCRLATFSLQRKLITACCKSEKSVSPMKMNKFEVILHFIPRFRRCCCLCCQCSLKTGCTIIGTLEVISGFIAILVQLFFVMTCFKLLDTKLLFGSNLADTVSDYADDYCAGLSVGYAIGSLAYTATGVMLLVAITWNILILIKIWLYLMVSVTVSLSGCYIVAIYALIEFAEDRNLIATPSIYELLLSVVLVYCMSIVKSYYLMRKEVTRHEERVERDYFNERDIQPSERG